MAEPTNRPRFPRVEAASSEHLKRGLTHTLTALGYRFNQDVHADGGMLDFEAFDGNSNVVLITVTPGTADEIIIAMALKHLGWYQVNRRGPTVQAWVIAHDFTQGAVYAASACPALTLKSYEAEISLGEGWYLTKRP